MEREKSLNLQEGLVRYKVTSGSYLARNKPVVANGLEEQRKRLIMVARRNVQPDNQTKVSQTPKTVEIEEIREEPRSNGRLEELRREVEELEKSSSSERRELETLGLRNKNWSVNRKKLEDEHLLMLEALSESVQENKDLHKVKDSKTSEMLQLQAKERSLEEKLGELRASMNQLNSIERRADHIENDLNNYFTGFRSQIVTKAADLFTDSEPQPIQPSQPARGTIRIQVHVGNRQAEPQPPSLALDQRHGERIEVERGSRSTHIRVVGPHYQTSTGVPASMFEALPKLTFGGHTPLDPGIKKCFICQHNFVVGEALRKLSCQHVFHNHCLKAWTQTNDCCYICTRDIL